MRNVFILLLLFTNCLYSAEDPSRREQVSTNPFDQEPSSTIGGCINAITGAYIENATDLIIPGAEPIVVQRSHSSSHDDIENFEGEMLPYGWYTNHTGKLWFSEYWDVLSGTRKVPLGTCRSRFDFGMKNETNFKMEKGLYSFKPYSSNFIKGVTNTGSGYIGGITDPKNLAIYLHPKNKTCYSIDGSGTKRHYFARKKSKKGPIYFMQWERKPSGNTLHYTYDDYRRLSKIIAKNSEGKELSHVRIEYRKSKDNPRTTLHASDGRQVTYEHKTTGKRRWLKSVTPSDGIMQAYHHKKGYEDYESLIAGHEIPDGNYRNILYFSEKKDKRWLIPDEDRFRAKSYKLGRVHRISEPVGPAGQEKVVYEMHYNENRSAGNGLTTVIDGLGRHTRYHYDRNKMLTCIQRHNNGGPSSRERFLWDKGKLTAKFLLDDDKIYYSKIYKYNPKGNILAEHLLGNLTGHCLDSKKMNKDGITPEVPQDRYITRYTYSRDGYNLPLSKFDNWSKTTYTYLPETNLKTGEFVWDGDQIKLRKLFAYDQNATLVKEITDDGSSQDPDDLTNVTQRNITYVVPREEAPIGFPREVIEKYLDLTTGEEVQLKRTVSEHSTTGQLLHQEHYDANNELLCSQSWKYDEKGNVIEEVDPMGRLITRQYNTVSNLIAQEGPVPGQHTTFTYDKAGRLTSQSITDPEGNQFNSSFKYDAMGQKVEATDAFGQVTNYKYDHHGNCVKEIGPVCIGKNGKAFRPTISTTYDAMNTPLTQTNANGEVTTFCHTIRKQPSKITYADHTFEEKHYRPDGQLLKEIAKNGLATHYTRDYQSRVTKKEIFSPVGEKLSECTYTYDAFHLLSETDEKGAKTHYTYDGAGHLIKVTK